MALHPSERDNRRRIVVPLAIAVVAGLAAIVLAVTASDESDQTAVAPTVTSAEATLSPGGSSGPNRAAADPMALGDVSAPVVMISYSEFQCPFCGRYARETEPELIERYVDDGVLRIEWRDFPYLGEESLVAAKAARAAAAQDMFWEFHEQLFADQPQPNSGRLTTAFVEEMATDLGLDVDLFRADMNSADTLASIEADFNEALAAGVNGTPAFVINGEPVFGAQPTDVFADVIERAAAAAPDR